MGEGGCHIYNIKNKNKNNNNKISTITILPMQIHHYAM